MSSTTAFVSAVPVLSASPVQLRTTSFTARRTATVAPIRRAAIVNMVDGKEKIPQGFTGFSETLNGRAAMMGFMLAMVTEAITGKGIIGQVSALFDIVNGSSALGN